MKGVRQQTGPDQAQALQGASLFDEKQGFTSLEPATNTAVSGNNIVAARHALAKLDKDTLEKVFATRIGEKKLPPVLDAARRGAAHMVALFQGMGAALGIQNAYGFTAMHVAFDYNQHLTARAFLSDPKLREGLIDTARVTNDWVSAKLALLPEQPTDSDLDNLAVGMTEGNPKQLTTTDRLGLYVAHINEMDEYPSVFVAEGWNPEAALEHRIRTLIGWVAQEGLTGKKRDLAIREIAVTTEALQLERRASRLCGVEDPELTRMGLIHECDGILRKLEPEVKKGNPNLTRMFIPITTPKHQMYLELQPIYFKNDPEKYVLLHFDNLGYGNGAHSLDGKKVYPLRVCFTPSDENMQDLRELLVNLLSQRQKDGSVDKVYEALYGFMAKLTTRDLTAVQDPDKEDIAAYAQAAGNCTIANLLAGTMRRLGDFGREFLDFEAADAFRRETELGSEKRRRGAIETRQAVLKAKREE